MGNNNVIAGPKADAEEDKPRIEVQQNSLLEEINEFDFKEESQVVSEEENKDFHERMEDSSFGVPHTENETLDLTGVNESKIDPKLSSDPGDALTLSENDNNQENLNQTEEENMELYTAKSTTEEHEIGEAQNGLLLEKGELPSIQADEKQEILETEAVISLAEELDLLGDKIAETQKTEKQEILETEAVISLAEELDLLGDKIAETQKTEKFLVQDIDMESSKTISGNENNKDTDKLGDKIDEKQDTGKCLIQYTDSEVSETKSEIEANTDYALQIDDISSQIENIVLEMGNENLDIGKKESHIMGNITGEVTEESSDSEEATAIVPEKETVARELTVIMKEIGKSESDSREVDSENNLISVLPSPQLNSQDEEQILESELVSLKSPVSDFKDIKLDNLDPANGSSRLLETKLVSVLENEENSGRLSTGSIQEKPNLNPEHKRSPSLLFGQESEVVSLKLSDSDFENMKLETQDPAIGFSRLLETKLMTVLETEKNARRQSTGSIQEKPNLNPELKKSPSFVFDLPLESKLMESDQTPLLFQNKGISRSISSPSSQTIFLEEKTIQEEKSESDKLNGSILNLSKDEGNESFSKQDFETGSKENMLAKRSEKRRPRSSMFSTCICCTAAIS